MKKGLILEGGAPKTSCDPSKKKNTRRRASIAGPTRESGTSSFEGMKPLKFIGSSLWGTDVPIATQLASGIR